ncbi:MAG: chemotaxis protein CheX [Candidatus Omnitrophica bacterium]|nr:chemotaxis protein CheX [Candidatus Omnitrophota bacterium]
MIYASARDSFAMMAITPELVSDKIEPLDEYGLISTILFKGRLVGKINVFLFKEGAAKIVSLMLDKDVSPESHDTQDGIGEICNIIIGGVKQRCVSDGYDFDISIPSTRFTSEFKPQQPLQGDLIMMTFNCNGVEMHISFAYQLKELEAPKEQPAPVKSNAAAMLEALMKKKKG